MSVNGAQRQARDEANAGRNARPSQAWSDAQRAEALELAEEHGAAEAGRRTGIPAATIRYWRHKSGDAGPPAGADPDDWAATKRDGAQQAWETAQQALRRVRELLDEGKTLEAQRAALTMAILTDKSGVLEIAAAQADTRRARLTEEQADLAVKVLEHTLGDLGIPFAAGKPGRVNEKLGGVLAHYSRQASAGDGTLSGPAPGAQEARRAVLHVLAPDLAEAAAEDLVSAPPELAPGEPQRALSPPGDGEEEREVDEMVPPITKVQTRGEDEDEEEEEEEVVDAEIVDVDEDEDDLELPRRRAPVPAGGGDTNWLNPNQHRWW